MREVPGETGGAPQERQGAGCAGGRVKSRLATVLRYGVDVDPRDHANTPELRRLYELYDANVEAGACGTCAMDLAIITCASEFGRDYDPGKRECAKRPPRPGLCDERVRMSRP